MIKTIFKLLTICISISACSQQPVIYKNMKITVLESTPKVKVPEESIFPEPVKMIKASHKMYMRGAKSQYSIYINDIMVFNHRGPKDLEGCPNGAIPINHLLLKSGVHTVTGKVYPEYGEAMLDMMSELELCYSRQDFMTLITDKPDLFIINASRSVPGKEYNGLEDLPYFEMSKSFNATVGHELEGWSNSVDLNKVDEETLVREVNAAYNEIHKLLHAKDANKLAEMHSDFMDIRAVAFNYQEVDNDREDEIKEFKDMIKNRSFEVAPLPDSAFLHFYAYGKMVTLLDENANPIIRLVDKKDKDKYIELQFRFHKKTESDSLSII